ncbi:MAG TPA: DUF4384 domain-containing protein [Pirellulaceae bacterium]|nr:DUF4384 domain-containing protein [Pirellulaceae bacterium]
MCKVRVNLLAIVLFLATVSSVSAVDPASPIGTLDSTSREASAGEATVPPSGLRNDLFNDQPSFLVAAQVNSPNRDYREGDVLNLQVVAEEDAYLYILYQQADGQTFQVFPNKFQPDNLVKARQSVRVPAETDLFRWVVGAPYGEETIKVIATKEPVDVLANPDFIKSRFNPVEKETLKGIEVELGKAEPVRWAETDVTLHTYANTSPPAAESARRWGVFFGVSRHMLTPYVIAANGKDAGSDLLACHRDAQQLAEAMRTAGRLDGVKVFTNETATKANMHAAITEWLPSVSRPGDTVVIFYSGHTGQIPDQNGDEADEQDELIIPHDFIGGEELESLQKLYAEDRLSANERTFVEKLVAEFKDKPLIELYEATGVSDDAMARWVQRLDGRQLIFISDSCHSGGFATAEANFKSLQPNFPFDLMRGEAARLKDLGQQNHVLMCAAHANEVAAERVTRDLGVMTFSLIQFLNESRGSQTMEAGFKFCQTEMAKYFDAWNQALEEAGIEDRVTPSHPFFINYSTSPVMLKP